MSKVLVLYYSTYGHIETVAHAIAEGARAAGAEVDVKRVPETVPLEIAEKAHFKLDQAAPWRALPIWSTTTRSLWALARALAGFRARWRRSSIRRAASGRAAR